MGKAAWVNTWKMPDNLRISRAGEEMDLTRRQRRDNTRQLSLAYSAGKAGHPPPKGVPPPPAFTPPPHDPPPAGALRTTLPAGDPLAQEERAAAKVHAPMSREAPPRMICWDASCHVGCRQQAEKCKNAHVPIVSLQGVHECVCMQIARRGGLRNQPLIDDVAKINARLLKLRRALQAKATAARAGASGAGGASRPLPPAKPNSG